MQTQSIPDDLWNHPPLVLLYSYLVDKKIRQRTKHFYNGKVVTLKRDEVIITPDEISTRLQISQPEVENVLRTLTELEHIQFDRQENFLRIRLGSQMLPLMNSDSELAPGDGKIIPVTFPEFKEKYLSYVKEKRQPKTLENAQRVMSHFNNFYGEGSLHELKPKHLEEFFNYRKQNSPRKLSSETLRMDFRTIHAALQMAIVWEHIRKNPFDNVELPPGSKEKTPSMTEEEFSLCMTFVSHPMLKMLFEFYVKTGFRRGEALFLLWKNVDLETKIIHLVNTPYYSIKNGKERNYPISDDMENILRSITPISEFVFTNDKGELFKEDYITKYWKKIVRAAELNGKIKLHSLRASFTSWLAEKGVPHLVIQELLGHTHFTTTEKYLTVSVDEQRKALNKCKPKKNN
jgi:integrase